MHEWVRKHGSRASKEAADASAFQQLQEEVGSKTAALSEVGRKNRKDLVAIMHCVFAGI
jgi:hypothetical protein